MIKPIQSLAKWIASRQSPNETSPATQQNQTPIRSSTSVNRIQQLFSTSRKRSKKNHKQKKTSSSASSDSLATVCSPSAYLINYGSGSNNNTNNLNSTGCSNTSDNGNSSSDSDFEIIRSELLDDHQPITIENALSNVFTTTERQLIETSNSNDNHATNNNNNNDNSQHQGEESQSVTSSDNKLTNQNDSSSNREETDEIFCLPSSMVTLLDNLNINLLLSNHSSSSNSENRRTSETNSSDSSDLIQLQLSNQAQLPDSVFSLNENNFDLTGTSDDSNTSSLYLNDDFFSSSQEVARATNETENDSGFEEFLYEMRSEANRRMTFSVSTWPAVFISIEELARCGFFYLGRSDHVRCAFCSLMLHSWEPGDIPLEEHLTNNPNCDFLCGRQVSNVSIDSELTNAMLEAVRDIRGVDEIPPMISNITVRSSLNSNFIYLSESTSSLNTMTEQGAEMAIQSARRNTFPDDWPTRSSVDADELAAAGFYFKGPNDRVVCFSCKGELLQWEADDQPWVEHAKNLPNCEYLRLSKGEDFINKHRLVQPTESVPVSTDDQNADPQVEKANIKTKNDDSTNQVANATFTNNQSEYASSSADVLQCKICYEQTIGVVFVPCGHFYSCPGCSVKLTKCSMCRAPISQRIRAIV